jgi:hypothetical protein
MVSPLGQRQMFQTVNVESVKTASEVSGLLQREAHQKQAIADRMAEEQASVPEIPRTDAMRTEERRGRKQDQGREGSSRDAGGGEEPDPDESAPANPADPHLDFLA